MPEKKIRKNQARPGRRAYRLAALAALFLLGGAGSVEAARERAPLSQSLSMNIAESRILNADGSPDRMTLPLDGGAGPGRSSPAEIEICIRYTLITGKDESLALTARLEDPDSLPNGCRIEVVAVPSGRKNEGRSAGQIVLTGDPTAILTGLKSCATGVGASDGTRLLFRISSPAPPSREERDGKRTATLVLAFN